MHKFGGSVLFLDRSDINTDEIIPAKYLTEITKQALKPFLLEDLRLDGFNPRQLPELNARVIVTRENFGCGSSREHAPWALEVNQITAVIAQSFARIFRQNMFNGGMLAIELPKENIDAVIALSARPVTCTIDLPAHTVQFIAGDVSIAFPYSLDPFDEALVLAGGWIEYADSRY